MKILLIARHFWPVETPRSHRWTHLAAEMAKDGFEITVVTCLENGRPASEIFEKIDIHRVGHSSVFDFLNAFFSKRKGRNEAASSFSKKSKLASFATFLHQKVLKNAFFPDESIIWKRSATRLAGQILSEKKIDALITVSMPFAAHLVGERLKKRCPELVWLLDIGDPLALHDSDLSLRPSFFESINRRIERRILEKADAATVTNAATRARFEAFFGQKLIEKMVVAPPVFEFEKAENATFELKKQPNELHLGYFGALYRPFRSPEAVLYFLEKTENQRPELARRLVVHFFGNIKPAFFESLSGSPRVVLHGNLPRAEAQKAMLEMDVLLNIGNRGDYLLPSKSVEYLASGLPVLNFSNAENDPFSLFFKSNPTFLAVLVENDRLSKTEMERVWNWLEVEKPRRSKAETEGLLQPFRAKNVAQGIVEILKKK